MPYTMYVIRYYNALDGVQGRIMNAAQDLNTAKNSLQHFFTGVGEWEEALFQSQLTYVRYIDKGAGVLYTIQQVEIL